MNISPISAGLRSGAPEPIEPRPGQAGRSLHVGQGNFSKGAPSSDVEPVTVQGTVDADDTTPPATLTELLDGIFSSDARPLASQPGNAQFKSRNAAADLGARLGAYKAAATGDSLAAVLGAIGVEITDGFDLSDFDQVMKAVSEQISSQGLPPNLRGLIASLLHIEPTQETPESALIDPVLEEDIFVIAPTTVDAEPIMVYTAPLTDAVPVQDVDATNTGEIGLTDATDALEPLVISDFDGLAIDDSVDLALTADFIQKAFDVSVQDSADSFATTA